MSRAAASARGLFRATGKAAHQVLTGIAHGVGIYDDAPAREDWMQARRELLVQADALGVVL